MRIVKVAASIGFVSAVGMTLPAPAATASDVRSATGQTELSQRADGKTMRQVERQLADMRARGTTDAEIKSVLGLELVSTTGPAVVTPMSSNSAISVTTPRIYYDTGARAYYADAGWSWNQWPVDFSQSRFRQNIGGLDGFGIRFSQQVNSSGGSLVYCPKSQGGPAQFKCTSATNYWENSADGTSWQFQDVAYSDPVTNQWNVGTGTLVKGFKRIGSGCLQVGTTYAHGWSSTAITGFGVGRDGFSIQWNTSENHWQRASGLGQLGC